MSAVVIVGGVHIRIVIGIVIAEGNLFVDVHVIDSQAAVHGAGSCLANDRGHVLVGHAQLGGGKILHAESTVGRIQTGIQDSHDHAAAVIRRTGGIKDTGIVHIDLIFNQCGLTLLVDLADDHIVPFLQGLAGRLEVTGLDQDLKTAEQCGIILTGRIGDIQIIQSAQDAGLLLRDPLLDLSGFLTGDGEFREAHRLIRGFIGIHDVDDIHSDDH